MEGTRREIRVYSNRRLYDPASRRYITYDEVYDLVRFGVALTILDRERGIDCTNKVLLDILIRHERESSSRGASLTERFLKELIRTASGNEGALRVSKFLDFSIETLLQLERDRESASSRGK